MSKVSDTIASRVKSYLENTIDVTESQLDHSYMSRMGGDQAVVIHVDTTRGVSLEPIYDRVDEDEPILTDKEVGKDVYFSGLTDKGLVFGYTDIGEENPNM